MDPRAQPFRASGAPPPIEHNAVLDASPNAIVSIDASGTITYANPQTVAAFGYARDEILGQPIEMLVPERLHARHVARRDGFFAHPVARPTSIGVDLVAPRKDGSEFPAETNELLRAVMRAKEARKTRI